MKHGILVDQLEAGLDRGQRNPIVVSAGWIDFRNELTDSVCNWILELQSNCSPSLSAESKVMMKCVEVYCYSSRVRRGLTVRKW